MPQIAKIAVSAATYAIDKPYDYLLPEELGATVGCRVLVPFGRGNRTCEGMILSVASAVPEKPLKAVRQLLDEEPILSQKQIKLALWMRQRYFCTFYDALHTILPAGVWYSYRESWQLCSEAVWDDLSEREASVCCFLKDGPRETSELKEAFGEDIPLLLRRLQKGGKLCTQTQSNRKVQDKIVQFVRLCISAEEALEQMEKRKKSAPRQYDAVAFLARHGETAVHELCYFTGVSRQALRRLTELEIIAIREEEVIYVRKHKRSYF